jgi:hypothetical protein
MEKDALRQIMRGLVSVCINGCLARIGAADGLVCLRLCAWA